MSHTWLQEAPLPAARGAVAQFVSDAIQLFVVAAFIYSTTQPAEVLAFADQINISHEPLEFAQDDDLANEAVSSDSIKHGRVRRFMAIPTASRHLSPGVAIRVLATGYSSTADQTVGDPFITASGTHVRVGTLAANFLPFGSTVRIGDNLYTVEDRLNERYNGKYIIDIWFPSRAEALTFGVRAVELEIVSMPAP